MAIVKTPQDVGASIRMRRKQLGWNQQALAKAIGVSRLWVIEIEKGKARAELALVLRALQALGLSLEVQSPKKAAKEGVEGKATTSVRARPDINQVVEHATRPATVPNQSDPTKSINETSRILELARQADPGRYASAASKLSELARQADPNRYVSAASKLSELAKQTDPGRYLSAVTRLSELLESTGAIAGTTGGKSVEHSKRKHSAGKATKKAPSLKDRKKR